MRCSWGHPYLLLMMLTIPGAACRAAAAGAVYSNCCLNCAGSLVGTLPTSTGGMNPYRMFIQDDGNVRIMDSNATQPKLMWQTNTANTRVAARAALRRQALPDASTVLELGPGKH